MSNLQYIAIALCAIAITLNIITIRRQREIQGKMANLRQPVVTRHDPLLRPFVATETPQGFVIDDPLHTEFGVPRISEEMHRWAKERGTTVSITGADALYSGHFVLHVRRPIIPLTVAFQWGDGSIATHEYVSIKGHNLPAAERRMKQLILDNVDAAHIMNPDGSVSTPLYHQQADGSLERTIRVLEWTKRRR